MRGIRGATTVETNSVEEIHTAAQNLIVEILSRNHVDPSQIGAAIFSMTEDLTAAFPTAGARKIPGFELVPLFDARQCAIEGSLERCIRVLLLVETEKSQREVYHVYQGRAKNLRPDLRN